MWNAVWQGIGYQGLIDLPHRREILNRFVVFYWLTYLVHTLHLVFSLPLARYLSLTVILIMVPSPYDPH